MTDEGSSQSLLSMLVLLLFSFFITFFFNFMGFFCLFCLFYFVFFCRLASLCKKSPKHLFPPTPPLKSTIPPKKKKKNQTKITIIVTDLYLTHRKITTTQNSIQTHWKLVFKQELRHSNSLHSDMILALSEGSGFFLCEVHKRLYTYFIISFLIYNIISHICCCYNLHSLKYMCVLLLLKVGLLRFLSSVQHIWYEHQTLICTLTQNWTY